MKGSLEATDFCQETHRVGTLEHKLMDNVRRGRYAYFLIWGNGLSRKEEIIGIIRSKKFLRIVRIMGYRPKRVGDLVRAIYSYDYAPLRHLRSKTRYLLKTEPDVILIFVFNEDAQETYFGEGAFRHIECERIRGIKEEIRDKFNPREGGRRSEEHVIHVSDNESQVDHILKYLGFEDGIGFLSNVPNPILSLPYYLPQFREFSIRRVNASQVYCNSLRGPRESFRMEAVEIEDTPHFAFLAGDTRRYEEYVSKWCMGGPVTSDYCVDNFLALSRNLAYLEDPYSSSYILVKEFQPHQYLILDGVHRASILKYRGVDSLAVVVMK